MSVASINYTSDKGARGGGRGRAMLCENVAIKIFERLTNFLNQNKKKELEQLRAIVQLVLKRKLPKGK